MAQVDRIVLPRSRAFGMGIKNLKDLNMVDALNEEVIKNESLFLGYALGCSLCAGKF